MGKIKQYLKSCVAEGVFPGASWAVGNSGGVLETGSVGLLGKGLGPVNEDTIYDLASLTKIFTALSIMKQLEDGLIRLEDEIQYFLPSYKNNHLGSVTIFALLTHTAPFPGVTKHYQHAKTREELLESIRSTKPRSDSNVLYTCDAFILLGEISSAVENASLDKIVRQRVLEPLKMTETCYNPPVSLLDRIAPTEECSWRGKLVRGEVHDENALVMGGVSGNAGLFSNIVDVQRLALAVLASLEKGTFLHKANAELMIRNHTAGRGENRGLCWSIAGPGSSAGELMSPRSFGHTGFTGTKIWIDPDRKLYTVLLSNRIHPLRDNESIFRTRHIFDNLAILEYAND